MSVDDSDGTVSLASQRSRGPGWIGITPIRADWEGRAVRLGARTLRLARLTSAALESWFVGATQSDIKSRNAASLARVVSIDSRLLLVRWWTPRRALPRARVSVKITAPQWTGSLTDAFGGLWVTKRSHVFPSLLSATVTIEGIRW